ncbi:head maturation protease, ClpP-related [Brevibacterium aurantiacum]|uniref:head maturation protease, ClpP-related n=1 Tax=Brevibacterium aurantiacum TaxID=273384 RepID=UPI003F90829B
MNKNQWFSITNKANDKTADILVYDDIGGWFGVEASEFVREVQSLDVSRINLFVNSPGGDVFDAIAIANSLRRHKAKVVATVDGLAASAASFLIQAADEIVMGKGSELMIHEASGGVMGNAQDMAEMAAVLDQVSNTIAELYADRAGETTDFWRDAMRAETWYSSAEAVDAGLADRVDGATTTQNSTQTHVSAEAEKFDLSQYRHHGRGDAPAPAMPTHPEPIAAHAPRKPVLDRLVALAGIAQDETASGEPPATPVATVDDTTGRTDDMSEAFMKGVRERLGVPADADLDENGVLNALDEVLAEGEATTNSGPAPAAPTAKGTVVMDETEHAELLASAEAGRAALAEQAKAKREKLVADAVRDGRIPVARQGHWTTQLEADEGAAEVLASLSPGTIPVDPIGYTGGVNETPDDASAGDALYSKLYPTAKEA